MKDAYGITCENVNKAAARSKRLYDSKMRYSTLLPGDRVLVRNLTPPGGSGKLRNHWEDAIHTVVRQVSEDIPVYELKPERGKGRSRTLHCNLLLPCDQLPLESSLQPRSKKWITTGSAETLRVDLDESDDDEDKCYPVPHVLPDSPQSERPAEITPQDNQCWVALQETEPDAADVEQLPDDNVGQVEDVPLEVSLHSSHPPPSPTYSDPGNTVNERPRHETRKPKVLIYDILGTPACYTVQALPYYTKRPKQWFYSAQPYYFQEFYVSC